MRDRLLFSLLLSLAAGGCALTPQAETPALIDEIRSRDRYHLSQSEVASAPPVQGWWRSIGGAELDEWVAVLQRDSLLLQEARLQARQAAEGVRIARGQRLPSLAVVSETSSNRTRGLGGDYAWSESYSAGVRLDLSADVWGGLRATERSSMLNALASELAVDASEQREIALLARNWVQAATLQRRLALARRTVDSFRSTYSLTDQRYRAGSASVTAGDVQIALQNLETAMVDLPQLETDLAQQLLVIDEQLARLPGETQKSFTGTMQLHDTVDAPVGRPAAILSRRPDVAIAELRYLAALEDVGAARTLLYPALSLSASLSFQADTPGEVFDWDRHIASLANALTAPIFQGGRLRSQVRLEEARAEELASAFARTALAAVMDVELALAELAGLQEQKRRLQAALETAQRSNVLAQGRYRQGLISILAVLETQRSLNAAEQNLILTDQAIANAGIDLYFSLGGDGSSPGPDAKDAPATPPPG